MTPQPSEQPRTAAGRAEHDIEHDLFGTRHTEPCNIVRRILAIEAEAAGTPDEPLWTDEQYIEYGAHQYRRGRAQAEAEAAAPDPVASPPDYAHWVERVAQALHDDCLLEWQGIAVVDPKRQVTKHMADAHYGMAHDLVRRLGLEGAVATPALDGDAVVRLLHGVGNTLWGWIRKLDGYDDGVLAHAIDFVIRHPDLEERLAAARLEGQPAADPGALGDQIVDEGRVSAFGPPGTTFTPERQSKP